MSWADKYIDMLKCGETSQFRPFGNSMHGKIESGQLVTVSPVRDILNVGDVVLCTVGEKQFLHLITKIRTTNDGEEYLIGNNWGGINGWIKADEIYGIVVKVER